MTNNCMRRTMHLSILSILFALVAVSFLLVGGASAHTISQAQFSQVNGQAQTARSCPSNTVHIILIKVGQFTETVFSCHSMTVKVGVPVIFVNNTTGVQFVVNAIRTIVMRINAGATMKLPTTQPEQVQLFVYRFNTVLNVTVVA